MTATEDRELRRALHSTLGSVPPSPVPIEAIIRRGQGIRLRRAGAAVGALGLAGVIAVAVLNGGQQPTIRPAAPAITAGPDGVFASGTANGHPWRLAVQNIADPGYPCRPAIVLNGTDADPVYPAPGNLAAVALGPALPGVGFGFIQLPATVSGIALNGQANIPAVTVTACGLSYHLAGFSYSLARTALVTVANPPASWPRALTVPQVSIEPPSPATTPENPGLWMNGGETAPGVLDTGSVSGPGWSIQIQFGTGGDCYAFRAQGSAGSAQMGYCGPVGTPDGPETIMALPLGIPSDHSAGATGYAVQVSPATARLQATLSNGSSVQAAFCVVDGRRYAAFVVRDPLRLSRLTWIDARGRAMASTTALPQFGYVQFQP
jgi:hypothetical protein